MLLCANICPVEVENYTVDDGKVICTEFGTSILLEKEKQAVM